MSEVISIEQIVAVRLSIKHSLAHVKNEYVQYFADVVWSGV